MLKLKWNFCFVSYEACATCRTKCTVFQEDQDFIKKCNKCAKYLAAEDIVQDFRTKIYIKRGKYIC